MERLGEIFQSMMTNKLRTFLTGFCVAWGIFYARIITRSWKWFAKWYQRTV